ncbi:acyl carrier protein [Guggenheimella bovis]
MFEIVRRIISEQMDVPEDNITLETRLIEDLKADSIDAAEMLINIESELNIRVPDEAIVNVKTVGDIMEFLEKSK